MKNKEWRWKRPSTGLPTTPDIRATKQSLSPYDRPGFKTRRQSLRKADRDRPSQSLGLARSLCRRKPPCGCRGTSYRLARSCRSVHLQDAPAPVGPGAHGCVARSSWLKNITPIRASVRFSASTSWWRNHDADVKSAKIALPWIAGIFSRPRAGSQQARRGAPRAASRCCPARWPVRQFASAEFSPVAKNWAGPIELL